MPIKKTTKIDREIFEAGVVPEITIDLDRSTKKWRCTSCGTRHSRYCDVVHHWYAKHFEDAKKELEVDAA